VLLAAALADVEPLADGRPARLPARRPRQAAADRPPVASHEFHLERHGDRVLGWRGELPPRELAVLGSPAAPVEATLDLHGHTAEEAREGLATFLARSRRSGLRTLLVVTGHGRGRPGAGVLRVAVPAWLAAPPLAARLLAFATARPEHGGAGAIYLRLAGRGR
jgi:DNA-nicking Smr family endonuclease